MTELMDPPEPPEATEGDYLKAKDLKNTPLVLRPTSVGTDTGKDGKEYQYVACDVWVLDRAGVTNEGSGVRIGWWRARRQIENAIGRFIACRPKEQDDRSVILVPLSGDAKAVAQKVIVEIESQPMTNPVDTESPPDGEYGDEPF